MTKVSNGVRVIKVLGSESARGIDLYTSDGKIYPFLYLPDCLQGYICSVETGEDYLHEWDDNDLSSGHHLEVLEAEDMEILYEAEN